MLITPEHFRKNLAILKEMLPLKPEKYTSDYPKTIEECLLLYCNQRTTSLLESSTYLIHENNWPLPLWYNPIDFKIGFINKLNILTSSFLRKSYIKDKGFGYISYLTTIKILYKRNLNEIIVESFDANKKYAFNKLENYSIVESKIVLIKSIRNSYLNKNYTACATTILPLIDYVSRKLLNSNNLTHDVKKITRLFEKNGFSLENSDDLMPMMNFIMKSQQQPNNHMNFLDYFEKMKEFDYGVIGCALSSFIRFANTYYSFYKYDGSEEDTGILNRHAILHGSSTTFGTKENSIKLITFLFLLLELEKVFEILLKPDNES